MTQTIFCKKYKKHMRTLNKAPFPGNLGDFILNNISADAWHKWDNMQMKIINEYKLNLFNKEHRAFIVEQMKDFLNISY